MAWVRMVEESEADGIVKEEYERHYTLIKKKGGVAEIIKVFSLRPDLLRARVEFGNAMTFGGSGLGRYREELIATSISAQLSCKF
ncbi:MAG: peroxidase [Deltaproteobacteria bacterium]|nr:peroxidase [Deltaproteobacteria bacterium]